MRMLKSVAFEYGEKLGAMHPVLKPVIGSPLSKPMSVGHAKTIPLMTGAHTIPSPAPASAAHATVAARPKPQHLPTAETLPGKTVKPITQQVLENDWGGAIPPKFQDPLLIKGQNPNLAAQILQRTTHHTLPEGTAWQANQQMRDLFARQLAQQKTLPTAIMPKIGMILRRYFAKN